MIQGVLTRCRPIELADQPFVQQVTAERAVRVNVVGWEFPVSLHQQNNWFAAETNSTTKRYIAETEAGSPVGITGLWDINWHDRNAVIGVKLGGPDEVRGKGFALDIVLSMMAFAFYDVGLERLHCTILSTNQPSIKVFTNKCGFIVEGVLRKHVWRGGEYVDVIQAGILRSEFDRLPDVGRYTDLYRASIDAPTRPGGV